LHVGLFLLQVGFLLFVEALAALPVVLDLGLEPLPAGGHWPGLTQHGQFLAELLPKE